MMQPLLDIVSWALILAGSFFTVVGAIGLVRMPDVYTRTHAASVTDTPGGGLLLAGACRQALSVANVEWAKAVSVETIVP